MVFSFVQWCSIMPKRMFFLIHPHILNEIKGYFVTKYDLSGHNHSFYSIENNKGRFGQHNLKKNQAEYIIT